MSAEDEEAKRVGRHGEKIRIWDLGFGISKNNSAASGGRKPPDWLAICILTHSFESDYTKRGQDVAWRRGVVQFMIGGEVPFTYAFVSRGGIWLMFLVKDVSEDSPVVFDRWSDYEKLRHPNRLTAEKWYEYLDEIDEGSRSRQRAQAVPKLTGKSRDDVAAWLAKQHFIVDSGIREVWYLPRGAPADEIRLLETNDRLAPAGDKPEPIDFGLDVDGAPFRLFVADVTTEQLDQIKRDPSRLPAGWSLEGMETWRRGA